MMKFGSRVLHTGNEIDPVTGAVTLPIHPSSTFHQEDVDNMGKYDYARSGNPTREALENILADLEGGVRGFAFSSGMAAISTALLLFSPGDHLVAAEDIYGGTFRALTRLFSRLGLETTFVDASDLEAIRGAIRPNTKGLLLETPSNPLLKITDLRGAAAIAREHGLISLADNTFQTPYLQRPLELGIDVVLHSMTKFLGGHSDVIAGAAVVKDPKLAKELAFLQNSFGAVLGPHDCWLVMRGIKTLKVRMDQHQQSAMTIATWLKAQPWVAKVYYPGLPDHPGHSIAKSQQDGFGGVLSFDVGDVKIARRIMKGVKLPAVAVSLGGVETILSYPAKMSHAAMPAEERLRRGITDSLLRLSVGLEEPEDLIADLEQGAKG